MTRVTRNQGYWLDVNRMHKGILSDIGPQTEGRLLRHTRREVSWDGSETGSRVVVSEAQATIAGLIKSRLIRSLIFRHENESGLTIDGLYFDPERGELTRQQMQLTADSPSFKIQAAFFGTALRHNELLERTTDADYELLYDELQYGYVSRGGEVI